MESYVQGALHSSFCGALYISYFGKVLLMNFASTWNKLFRHCISVEVLLVEGYVQGAVRKEMFIASFFSFKNATLARSY